MISRAPVLSMHKTGVTEVGPCQIVLFQISLNFEGNLVIKIEESGPYTETNKQNNRQQYSGENNPSIVQASFHVKSVTFCFPTVLTGVGT